MKINKKDIIITILIIFLFVSLYGLGVYKGMYDKYREDKEKLSFYGEPKITYEDLNENQIENIKLILNVTREELLNFQRTIKFTGNISKYVKGGNAINRENGDLIISYYRCVINTSDKVCEEYELGFREQFCHELLHTFLNHPYEEQINERLDEFTAICYTDVWYQHSLEPKWRLNQNERLN